MMRKLAVLSAAGLIAAGAIASTPSEARDRSGAVAAGIIGGLAAGALIGAAASNAHAAPAYGYSYPAYGYDHPGGYGYRPVYNRFYDDGFHARPHYKRVVLKQFVADDVEECRVIVKRRYNAFGDLVVKRMHVCD